MTVQLHNTLTKRIDPFVAQSADRVVSLYTCGPTVYSYLHVGNWAAYLYWDTLVRTLQASDYTVNRVMNITDVDHLVSDEDEGEDKLEKGARREGKTAWEVAEFYGQDFLQGLQRLNAVMPQHITKATDYIQEQLELVRVLQQKGHTYQIDDGIYFDTSTFASYAEFAHLDLAAQRAGARVEFNQEKRNPSDFALWKFTPAGQSRDMEWPTPGDLVADGQSRPGFPGWHLECSAMAMSILGQTLDIHTGGIDHIPVHHTNEIAQSEAASGQRFSNYWLHNNHLKVDGTKISKSLENGFTLDDLAQRGFDPLDFRLFILQSHYRTEGNFTFANLEAAKNRRNNWRAIAALRHQTHATTQPTSEQDEDQRTVSLRATSQAIIEALQDDLGTPQALALIDEAFSRLEGAATDRIHRPSLLRLLETIDDTLGLDLQGSTPDISDEAKRSIMARQVAREAKDWAESDKIRDQLLAQGITLRDTPTGPIWHYS